MGVGNNPGPFMLPYGLWRTTADLAAYGWTSLEVIDQGAIPWRA
jgi:hypothetical protein